MAVKYTVRKNHRFSIRGTVCFKTSTINISPANYLYITQCYSSYIYPISMKLGGLCITYIMHLCFAMSITCIIKLDRVLNQIFMTVDLFATGKNDNNATAVVTGCVVGVTLLAVLVMAIVVAGIILKGRKHCEELTTIEYVYIITLLIQFC